ncbi:MAG: hypothetical protein ACJ8G2_01895 [Burkholderiales bacterium]|jgi:hypothetical protein
MKLKTAIAVLVVGLCPVAVWAGAEQDSAPQPQASEQKSSASDASGESAQNNGKVIDWQYVNGRAADKRGMQSAQPGSDADSTSAADAEDSDGAQDQSASEEAGQDQAMGGQSMQLEGIPEGLEDKLVVILPTNWQGSLRDLLSALEQTSQDSEILVLKRGDQDADMSSQDSAEDVEETSDASSR